ncbi:hypothetical protein EHS25_002416 [Saitozyma podzolica]|uniref:Glycosyltransferase family 34 protein n=1 Tax=Saitozyma podzolica TaxID=1890683 RepID=A0A427YEB5_9TREE|nr:hypothetical protein EHS25_002416 [Saitozyma podzolica]
MGVSTVIPASHRKTAAFIAVWIFLVVVTLTHLAGSGSKLQAYLTGTTTYTPPRILILQQIHSGSAPASKRAYGAAREEPDRQAERQALYEASVSSHRRYAEEWGYEYRLDRREWVSGAGGLHFLNKIYALLDAVVQALGDEQGPEWIMLTDADSLILNPSIPLHALLPPPFSPPSPHAFTPAPLEPPPLILGNQDGNGFNAGVVMFRVDPRLAAFIMSMLAHESELATLHKSHPSDQYLFGYTIQLEENKDVADAFYEIPMMWINEYWLDNDEGSQRLDGVGWTPQLQVHLCNGRWWWSTPDWREKIVGHANALYEEANLLGQGNIRSGLESMEDGQKTEYAVRRWWRKGNSGIKQITFTET